MSVLCLTICRAHQSCYLKQNPRTHSPSRWDLGVALTALRVLVLPVVLMSLDCLPAVSGEGVAAAAEVNPLPDAVPLAASTTCSLSRTTESSAAALGSPSCSSFRLKYSCSCTDLPLGEGHIQS